ncbi:hypothetical protein FE411_08155 [Leuconostoc mesenteroides]|uniref:hypothetical protein n=1 Tax=Leuconostoc mesenteroides TaxID=1245 RepID=UPI00123AD143|nr:hypothetical protein [Leuconostoc mesenteroides]KAA8346121.1 hypothetical protein FE411_08155 [Leuconostoc mesenteroides]
MAYQPTDWEHGDIITGGKLNKIEQELTHVADNATYGFGGAQLSSDGLTPFSYINAGDPMPSNPKKGDTVFLKDGNDFLIYSYNGEDWVLKVDPDLSNRIEETIKTASDNTDKAIADNNTQINETINQVAKEQADLAVKDGDFNNKAQAMADKALSDAKANTATVAQETLNSANQNIADAKKSVTDDIAQEASDRASAVSALDTKAQGYADDAKKNAIDVATSADGVINKKIDDTASSITSTVSQNKMDAEGKITTAQSTATQALNGLSSKVDTSTYNTKTGQLSTDVTNVTQTANQAKTDIASIKQTDTTQDARMTTIEADASGTKATVSNLQTAQGKQSGSISTLQQRADGFDATVTKVDNLSIGGRNYFITSTAVLGYVYTDGSIHGASASNADMMSDFIAVSPNDTWQLTGWQAPSMGGNVVYAYYDSNKSFITGSRLATSFPDTTPSITVPITIPSGVAYMRVSSQHMDSNQGARVKVEKGTKPTDWTPAPEDVDNATAKAQLTADNASVNLSKYQTDADGRISRAQAGVEANTKSITAKVSQTDYDKKTGDLTTAVSKAQTTADGVVTTVGNYKTSNDARVKATETSIAQNAKDITAKVSQTDYDKKTGELSGSISTLQQRADGFDATVTKVNNLAVGGRNYFLNSSGTSLDGWSQTSGWAVVSGTNRGTVFTIKPTATWGGGNYNAIYQNGINIPSGTQVTVSFWAKASVNGAKFHSEPNGSYSTYNPTLSTAWTRYSYTFTLTTTTIYFMGVDAGTIYYLDDVKIETGNVATDWTPAPEDIESALAQVKLTADGVSSIVSNPTTGLSTRVQTAEGILSKVKGTDIPALQNATFWQPYSSLNFNDYTKQGSFFFNTTTAKTNGPTTSTAWTYLMVEQGTSDNGRIKQTAWYDGVAGVKITYVRTLNSGTWSPWYANDNDSVTTISQTNSDVKQEIADRKTGDSNTLQSSKDFTQSSITSYDKGMQTQLTQTNSSILATVSANNLVVDSSLTDSALSNSIVNWDQTGLGNFYYSSGVAYQGVQSIGYNQTTLSGGFSYLRSQTWSNYSFTGSTLNVSVDVKVNKMGGTSTDNLEVKLVEYDAKMNLIVATSITGVISSVQSAWTNYRKKITINSSSRIFLLSYNMQGNGNVYIARPYVGIQELVAGGYTAGFNNNNQTILSLFKDNWSIGITDNISKITSGIVGNASQMSLISKNVTIDSPNTQIKGTAWIQSAMIANGAIGSAQIGDATITSAKIAQLDVAKLTGNVSNFIQSNWNGLYQSVKISPIGMTISTSQGSTAQFNQDGLVLDGALGTTNVLNGQIELISSANEYLGTFQHETMPEHDNVDYLMIKLAGWHTSKPGDSDYDSNSDSSNTIRGGDGIGFGVTNSVGTYDMKMSWDSSLVAGYKGRKAGWHVEDIMTWHQPTYFEGGFDVAQQFSSTDRRALHIQGATLSNGHKWFGFFDTPSQAGFGTDDTNDVLFYVKGKSYSLYTMLNKLSML